MAIYFRVFTAFRQLLPLHKKEAGIAGNNSQHAADFYPVLLKFNGHKHQHGSRDAEVNQVDRLGVTEIVYATLYIQYIRQC